MGFVKVIKNKAYYKRFQVKFRRRSEGNTDYQQRHKLITQAKNKYNTPKYRLVVRFTNSDIVCQIAYATLKGDVIVTAAYAHELPRYGLTVGTTNYASAYAVGLLLARRHLTNLKLHEKYQGKTKVTGEDWKYEADELELQDGPRPFRCILDVGLVRTTKGARVFATLKGACDGGLDIPHSETRFQGYDKKKETLDSKKFRYYLFGGHVADYMKKLQKENPEKYKKQFSQYLANGIGPADLEPLYTKVHAAIRANPAIVKRERTKPAKPKKFKQTKRSLAQRQARVAQKKLAANKI